MSGQGQGADRGRRDRKRPLAHHSGSPDRNPSAGPSRAPDPAALHPYEEQIDIVIKEARKMRKMMLRNWGHAVSPSSSLDSGGGNVGSGGDGGAGRPIKRQNTRTRVEQDRLDEMTAELVALQELCHPKPAAAAAADAASGHEATPAKTDPAPAQAATQMQTRARSRRERGKTPESASHGQQSTAAYANDLGFILSLKQELLLKEAQLNRILQVPRTHGGDGSNEEKIRKLREEMRVNRENIKEWERELDMSGRSGREGARVEAGAGPAAGASGGAASPDPSSSPRGASGSRVGNAGEDARSPRQRRSRSRSQQAGARHNPAAVSSHSLGESGTVSGGNSAARRSGQGGSVSSRSLKVMSAPPSMTATHSQGQEGSRSNTSGSLYQISAPASVGPARSEQGSGRNRATKSAPTGTCARSSSGSRSF